MLLFQQAESLQQTADSRQRWSRCELLKLSEFLLFSPVRPLWLPSTPQWAGTSATLNGGAGEPLAVNKCQSDLHRNHLFRLLLSAYNLILKQFFPPNRRRGLFWSAARRWGIVWASHYAGSLLLFSLREDKVKKQQPPLESCDNHCACGLECTLVHGCEAIAEREGGRAQNQAL